MNFRERPPKSEVEGEKPRGEKTERERFIDTALFQAPEEVRGIMRQVLCNGRNEENAIGTITESLKSWFDNARALKEKEQDVFNVEAKDKKEG